MNYLRFLKVHRRKSRGTAAGYHLACPIEKGPVQRRKEIILNRLNFRKIHPEVERAHAVRNHIGNLFYVFVSTDYGVKLKVDKGILTAYLLRLFVNRNPMGSLHIPHLYIGNNRRDPVDSGMY
jgi:hypothetical protein